jgi:nicotinic acid mononucleotide adenylyltransferase
MSSSAKYARVAYVDGDGSLAPREYVLLISGTMNPPHIGHVRLGLRAADRLRAEGHRVRAICYVPVHDNYLYNKVTLKRQSGKDVSVANTIAFPMVERCALLRALIDREPESGAYECHVLDYEHSDGAKSILAESPAYWAPKLPGGYLRTVPTTSLIAHFAEHSPLLADGGRLAIAFGVDNLAGMSSWNSPRSLLGKADLVLLARGLSSVTFAKDPSDLLGAVKHLEVRAPVPVLYAGEELLGGRCGSFVNARAAGEAALLLLPPLDGDDQGLSSTAIREAISTSGDQPGTEQAAGTDDALATLLSLHGYPASMRGRLLATAADGAAATTAMGDAGKQRGEWVGPPPPPAGTDGDDGDSAKRRRVA